MAFIVLSREDNRVDVLVHKTVYHDNSVCVYSTCADHEKNGTHLGVQNAKQKQGMSCSKWAKKRRDGKGSE